MSGIQQMDPFITSDQNWLRPYRLASMTAFKSSKGTFPQSKLVLAINRSIEGETDHRTKKRGKHLPKKRYSPLSTYSWP
jgi:hypothetical protein